MAGKGKLICPNPECSPLYPFDGVKMVRQQYVPPSPAGTCVQCPKVRYDYDACDGFCPTHKKKLVPVTEWCWKCPKHER